MHGDWGLSDHHFSYCCIASSQAVQWQRAAATVKHRQEVTLTRRNLQVLSLSSKTLLQALAEADVHEVVSTICEIPLDFRALDSHVFTVGGDAWPDLNTGKKFADGLKSVLTALNLRPGFCFRLPFEYQLLFITGYCH